MSDEKPNVGPTRLQTSHDGADQVTDARWHGLKLEVVYATDQAYQDGIE